MTQSDRMPVLLVLAAVLFAGLAPTCLGQKDLEVPESFEAAGEHPRLFLTAARLKRLQRERDREALRWEPFRLLITGHARMPEPGLALALYYQVTGDAAAGRQAVDWALGGTADLRQSALVYDWCQAALSGEQASALEKRLEQALGRPPRDGIAETRDRALAAIALADRAPQLSQRELERIVTAWWRGRVAPALASGHRNLSRPEIYALLELLHAIRDNVTLDVRDSARGYFLQLPLVDLLGYYPAIYPAGENDYRIPAAGGEVDLRVAALARAADLALVAYDTNATENQYLQGWLMHDRFQMRGAFGAPYELLWANPYQPGLSYYNAPLQMHTNGQLFLRASWDDGSPWLAWVDGELQTFEEGGPRRLALKPGTVRWFGDAAVVAGAPSFVTLDRPAKSVFVVGLAAAAVYQVEFDNREMSEERTDAGGILEFHFSPGFRGGLALRTGPWVSFPGKTVTVPSMPSEAAPARMKIAQVGGLRHCQPGGAGH